MFIFKFILLISNINSSLIYELIPSSLVQEEFKSQVLDIQSYKSISKVDFGTFHFQDEILGIVDLLQIKQQLNYLDVSRLSLSIDPNSNFVLDGKNGTMTMDYTFSYRLTDGLQDVGSFSIQSTNYQLIKKYYIINNTYLQPYANITALSFSISGVKFNGENRLKALIEASVNKLILDKTINITQAYDRDISTYYSPSTINQTHPYVTFQSKDPKLDFKLDIIDDKIPIKINDNNVIYYKSGNLNGRDSKDLQPIFDKVDKYQILVHRQIFSDFISDITKDGLLDFTLTQTNRPSNTQFNLDIKSLGQIIPDIYDEYSPHDAVKAWSKISGFVLDEKVGNSIAGNFTLYTEVYHTKEMKKIFIFESNFSFSLKITINERKLNVYLDNKSLDLNKVLIISPTNFSTAYISILTRWVESTLKNYLLTNKYYFLNLPLDLSPYIENISTYYCDNYGLRIFGTPINNYESNKLNKVYPNLKFLN